MNQFYISPTQRSDFSTITNFELESEIDKKSKSLYLVGMFDSNLVSTYQSQQSGKLNSQEKQCLAGIQGKNQKIMRSLGNDISKVNSDKDGFTIVYTGGD